MMFTWRRTCLLIERTIWCADDFRVLKLPSHEESYAHIAKMKLKMKMKMLFFFFFCHTNVILSGCMVW